jgi:hypothetical protein
VNCDKRNRRLFVSPLPENRSRCGEMLLSIPRRTGEPRSPPGIRRHYCPDVRSTWRSGFCLLDCPRLPRQYQRDLDSPGIHHPHMPPTLTSFGLAHNASFASQGQESFAVRMPVNKMCKLCEKAEQVFPNVYLENLLRGRRFKRRNVRNALKSGVNIFPLSRYFALRRRLKGLVK